MKVLLDMDGVIADFVGGAAELFNKDPATVTGWNINSKWEIKDEDFWGPMGFEFWEGLKKTIEADKIVATCEEAVGVDNVCLLSSPVETKGCVEGKLSWIRKHYPQYSRRFLFGPAKQFAAGNDTYLVDDADHNVEAFTKVGGRAFLYPRPWNARASWQLCTDDSPLDGLRLALKVSVKDNGGGHPEYLKLLDEMKALHIKKSSDYGRRTDPFTNVRASLQFGVPAWIGTMIRANDKMVRIQSFIQNGSLKNESVEDSLMDLAAYSLIALALRREEQNNVGK